MTEPAPIPAYRMPTVTRPVLIPAERRRGWFRGWAAVGAGLAIVNVGLLVLAVVLL